MGKCIYSHDDGAYCDKHDHGAVTVGCCGEGKCPDRKALTNADKIRAMTDEELAGILAMQSVVSPPWCAENYDCPYADQDPARCDLCALDWLKQEANDDT